MAGNFRGLVWSRYVRSLVTCNYLPNCKRYPLATEVRDHIVHLITTIDFLHSRIQALKSVAAIALMWARLDLGVSMFFPSWNGMHGPCKSICSPMADIRASPPSAEYWSCACCVTIHSECQFQGDLIPVFGRHPAESCGLFLPSCFTLTPLGL